MNDGRNDAGTLRGHVALSSLAMLEPAMPSSAGWLTEDERARLASIGATLRRRQFLAGHWLARQLAAGATGVDAARIGMDRDGLGRPRLLLDGMPSPWHVSLTHSDDRIAGAVARRPVGIDLEVPRRARDLAALARFTFSPAEVVDLDAVAAEDRVAAFYRLWALKEARGKRCGEGIMPRRARLATAVPVDADSADAVTWTVDAVTLAVATDGAADLHAIGLPDDAVPGYWRIVETVDGSGNEV